MIASLPTNPTRLVYLGTPEIAVSPLVELCDAGFEIAMVVTGRDKRRGRGSSLSHSPVKVKALELGLPVTHELSDLLHVETDLGVVVAFGQIISKNYLEQIPMLNLHFSLLPRWRGAAPVERSILAGDLITGVCLMVVEEELDTGSICARQEVEIGDQTGDELRQNLVEVGSSMLVKTLKTGLKMPVPQTGSPTYAHKISPDDLLLDWNQPVEELMNKIRLGGAWTTFRGNRFKIWSASVGSALSKPVGTISDDQVAGVNGSLKLLEVQAENRGRQSFDSWQSGARLNSEDRFI
ncbi:MAG TPA: methionyl-tRNA formyltransferase [Acidimicrobiales bacterium]|nr:methionyl-tRNA formyltransferase [Acidimicrobiales bacterium]